MDNKSVIQQSLDIVDGKLNLPLSTYLEACTHCGLCADACHLYRADPAAKHIPCFKADTVRKVYQRHFTPLGRLFPWLYGVHDLNEDDLDAWVEPVFQCTMCRRCTIECPLGIDNAAIIATARTILAKAGKAPPTLAEHARLACDVGSPLGMSREKFLDRVEWIEEELQDDLDDDDFTVPIDVVGADILFIPASLEVMKYPFTFLACLKILHVAGASWTLSSERFDVTNYGVFLGDPEITRTIAMRDIEEAKRLGVNTMVTSECGHAYRALRWEAPDWFQEPLPFAVKNIVELADEWVKEGRLELDSSANTQAVTYHDPCNITRNGGVIEEPRRLLQASVQEFREMTPNRERNWCCGGGGGFHSMPEYNDVRLQSGLMKANQIRGTETAVVATTCANCQIQLGDLSEHYELGVKCVSVTDLVAQALVI
ncbi:MAG: (Fe-S)-binding protein [Chloroflexi bacterium]|nr:(Fe-S)-binding protein [Chloroflexota bacterium]